MHTRLQHDQDGETIVDAGHHVRHRPGKTQAGRAMVWWPRVFVVALLAATTPTIFTATAAEAKKCKTLRLPSGERFASCARTPRVISPYGDIYAGRGWVIGGDRYSQRKASGY